MDKNKVRISLFMVICLIFIYSAKQSYAIPSDIDKHWAQVQINKWLNYDLIKGYKDNTFKPDRKISRAEFIALVNRVFQYRSKASIKFSDISMADWCYEDIGKAIKAGYINGYNNGTIRPDQPITREEAAKVLSVAFGFNGDSSKSNLKFRDVSSISSWAFSYVAKMADMGVIKGYESDVFAPKSYLTRAEAVSMLDRISGEIYNAQSGYEGKKVEGNMIVNKPDVRLKGTVIAGNLYLTEGIDSGDIELYKVTVKGNIYINGCLVNKVNVSGSNIGKLLINAPGSKIQVYVKDGTEIKDIAVASQSSVYILDSVSADTIDLEALSSINISERSSLNKLNVFSGAENSVIYSKAGVTVDSKASNITVNGEVIGKGSIVTKAYNFEIIDAY